MREPEPDVNPGPTAPLMWGIASLIAVGLVLRARQFAFGRSLWLDEAMLAVNIVSRSFAELFHPLDFHQNSPILFLIVEKALVTIFGVNEYSLRAFPFLCGVLLLPLMTFVALRVGGPMAGLLVASLAALSPALLRYSEEVKPYGVDAFASMVLISLALKLGEAPSRFWIRALGVAAPLSALISSPSVFVAASVFAGLTLRFRADHRGLRSMVGPVAAWLATFVMSYIAFLRPVANDFLVRDAYRGGFLPPSADSFTPLPLLKGSLLPAFLNESRWLLKHPVAPALALALLYVAAVVLVARRRGLWIAVMLGAPLPIALAAASLGLYPVGVPRLMVFWYPVLIVLGGGGVGLAALRPPKATVAVALFVSWCALLSPMAVESWRLFRVPYAGDNFKAAYLAYEAQARGEPVYVGARTQPLWIFYSTRWNVPLDSLAVERVRFYLQAGGGGLSFENSWPRRLPVPRGEGKDLAFNYQGRREILGLATGRRWNWPNYLNRTVDAGWAENEAERLRAATSDTGHSCAWLVAGHLREGAYAPLRRALIEGHSAQVAFEQTFLGAATAKLCFPSASYPDQSGW